MKGLSRQNREREEGRRAREGWVRYRLGISFYGQAYHGWQGQEHGRGVQDMVEGAMKRLLGQSVVVVGSSRTDAGVHAVGMVAHVDVPEGHRLDEADRLVLAMNACLPEDIRVMTARAVAAGFHARYDAVGKEYRYYVWNGRSMNAWEMGRMWHVPGCLDDGAMAEAAAMLVGRKDFRAMTCNRGEVLEDAVREVTKCQITRDGARIEFRIEGNGFLYKMCRGMVGTLIHIGRGKIAVRELESILAAGDRRRAGENAPAHGLVLWRVWYDGDA